LNKKSVSNFESQKDLKT